MASCNTQRKWFHINFSIKDRSNDSSIFSISSIDDNDYDVINNSGIISVRTDACAALTSTPAAWEPLEAPGSFYFRPTVAQLDGTDPDFPSNDVFVDVESYEGVIDESNRRNFEYEIVVAYDSSDEFDGEPTCTTTGPPNTECDEGAYETILDDVRGLTLRWPTVPFLTEIGCCNIELDEPGTDDDNPPTDVQDCARIWVIASDGSDYSLQYYDFDAISSEALISRGKIVDTGGIGITNEWHDLAWDDRNVLWGLEKNGLKQILPGNEDFLPVPGINGQAIALDYATLIDTEGSLTSLFASGLESPSFDGKPAMSYSQEQNKMYIYAGDMFFELSYINATTWEVIKSSSILGLGSDVGDLAFDASGNCYCSTSDNLSIINFSDSVGQGFGTIATIGSSSELSGIIGMDFILDLDSGDFLTFYGVHNTGTLYEINTADGSKSSVPGVSFQGTVVGMSSCQAGEDLRSYEVPIATGDGPWFFMISLTNEMAQQGSGLSTRIAAIKSELTTHITNNILDGEQISFMTMTDGNPPSGNGGGFSAVTTVTSIADATTFIDNMTVSSFSPDGISFCGSLGVIFDLPAPPSPNQNERLKSCTIIVGSDVQCLAFDQTPPTPAEYTQSIMDRAAIELDPNFFISTVVVNPTGSLTNLIEVSAAGGGIHTVWNI